MYSFTALALLFFFSILELLSNHYGSQNICSNQRTGDLMDRDLKLWYKYVPKHDEMNSFNCWYGDNPNKLPPKLAQRIKDVSTLADIQHQFSKEDLDTVLTVFEGVNKTSLHPTSQYFCLPKVYLIGFPKCGTTLLYKYFEYHPLFAKPRFKECQFWREYVKTEQDQYKELEVLLYLFHFFRASQMIRENPRMFTIDASASTVFASRSQIQIENDMCAIPLILFTVLPQSKFLIVLRNPVDRLWSDFWYFCHYSSWKTKFNQTALAPKIFHNYTVSAILHFNNCVESHSIFFCAMLGSVAGEDVACTDVRLGLGIYYVHIQRWFSVFPHNQLLLIRMEDLVAEPLKTMKEVWSFVGVFSTTRSIKQKINSNSVNEEFTMLPETRKELITFYSPFNLMLANLLDDHRYLWN